MSLTLSRVLQQDPEWETLPALSDPVERVLRRCLHKDPKARLRDIGEARVGIAEALEAPARDAGTVPAELEQ